MKILLSNDDGIRAPGLWALAEGLKGTGEVVVVAPDRDQSGVGTSVTLHHPLRMRRARSLAEGVSAYNVEGTPADSVILALRLPLVEDVGLVVSGANEGANLGDDILISGTVSAALQGYFYGIPSIAIAIADTEDLKFDAAARIASMIAQKVAEESWSERFLLNINLPNLPAAEIEGVELTRPGRRFYRDEIQEGHDGKREYYWLVRGDTQWHNEQGTDIWAVRQQMVSISALMGDLHSPEHSSFLDGLCPWLLQCLR
ncbi:5'/3'-nucleotidase SurE [Chloroflexota bacterium]